MNTYFDKVQPETETDFYVFRQKLSLQIAQYTNANLLSGGHKSLFTLTPIFIDEKIYCGGWESLS